MAELSNRHIVLGMAGHIDHGKTSIVKALTGIDTDRLKEEKERGMTTDLGFAFLGDEVAIIDVPGHEKFVKTMVAGVNTVDLALLVVAADDGVMPQTREHLEILRLLQIPSGLIALNKTDLAEKDWLELVTNDIRGLVRGTFLEHAPIIPVSTVSGEGINELGQHIRAMARSVQQRKDKGVFRLPIDRVFTIKGFGTVVAGTILAGKVRVDDAVELLPHGKLLKVRGLQVHDKTVTESSVGLRTAINLQGVEKELIERGDVLGQPGYFKSTSMVDAQFSYLSTATAKLANRSRIRFHVGTSEVVARIILLDREQFQPGDDGFVQIHFEKPVVADAGDRFVVRSYSPIHTIGGGSILDVHPGKHKRFQDDVHERLQRMVHGDAEQLVLEQMTRTMHTTVTVAELAKLAGIPADVCARHLKELEQKGSVVCFDQESWYSTANLDSLKKRIVDLLGKLHSENPLKAGLSGGELHSRIKPPVEKRLFDSVCKLLQDEKSIHVHGDRIALSAHAVQLSPDQIQIKEKIEQGFLRSSLMPPSPHEATAGLGKEGEKLIALLLETGALVRLEEGIVMHRDAIERAKKEIGSFLAKRKEAGLGEIREHMGITRKYALPLLLYLDGIGFTERDGDVRRLKGTK